MAASISSFHLGRQAGELISAHGRSYTQPGQYMRRGHAETHAMQRLFHEVGGQRKPLDLATSLDAVNAKGFELDHLPFEPTYIRFAGKMIDGEISYWQLFGADRRFGTMVHYTGDSEKAVRPATIEASARDSHNYPDELEESPRISGQRLAVAAVLLDYVAHDLGS